MSEVDKKIQQSREREAELRKQADACCCETASEAIGKEVVKTGVRVGIAALIGLPINI